MGRPDGRVKQQRRVLRQSNSHNRHENGTNSFRHNQHFSYCNRIERFGARPYSRTPVTPTPGFQLCSCLHGPCVELEPTYTQITAFRVRIKPATAETCVPIFDDFLFTYRVPQVPSLPSAPELLSKISDVLPVSTITSDKCKIQVQ